MASVVRLRGRRRCSDCTVCVTPESHASGALTIQQAVQDVKDAGGGTVCLEAGVYHLDEAGVVVDTASSLRIRGQGLRTVVIARGAGFQVTNSAFVTLEDFTVIGSVTSPAIELRTTVAVTVERLTVLALGNSDLPGTAIALGGVSLLTTVRDNEVIASLGITGEGDERPLLTAELDISDNLLVCASVGVGLAGRVGHLLGNSITSNTVIGAAEAGIRLLGAIAPGHACGVGDNVLILGGWGIEVATSGFTVDANDVTGTEASLETRGGGVAVLPSTFGSTRGATRVASNRVRDVGGRGIAVLAPVSSLEIVHNVVERALEGIVMDEKARAVSAVVSDNTVTDVGSRPKDENPGVAGIQVVGSERASVESNVVHGVGAAREVGDGSVGIEVLACARVAGGGQLRRPGRLPRGRWRRHRDRRPGADRANAGHRQPGTPPADRRRRGHAERVPRAGHRRRRRAEGGGRLPAEGLRRRDRSGQLAGGAEVGVRIGVAVVDRHGGRQHRLGRREAPDRPRRRRRRGGGHREPVPQPHGDRRSRRSGWSPSPPPSARTGSAAAGRPDRSR